MFKKVKIIIDDKIPFIKGVLEPFADVYYYPGASIKKEHVLDADALIVRTRTKCNSHLLDGSKVKLITTATIGYDHIDIDYCKKNNIKWLNAPGCNSSSVMQYIISTILLIGEEDGFSLSEKTIGIVGVGNVGSKIKKSAELLNMKVLLNDPPRERNNENEKFSDLKTIMEECDIITFHVPLIKDGVDKTYHLVDENFFSKLKKKPILFNSSRGEVVKTFAIKDAIKTNKVDKVVLDVWEKEPNIDLELMKLCKYSTPHIAGYSADGKANGTSVCVNAVNEIFNFGMNLNWFPESIPLANGGNNIKISCSNKSDQEIITEAIKATYTVKNDSNLLKRSPETFEKQRGDYPIRREFNNYTLELSNCNSETIEKLKNLKFEIRINN